MVPRSAGVTVTPISLSSAMSDLILSSGTIATLSLMVVVEGSAGTGESTITSGRSNLMRISVRAFRTTSVEGCRLLVEAEAA